MTFFNFAGTLNTLFITLSLYGIFAQLKTIQRRKSLDTSSASATSLLSLNQFSVSYLAYLAFFIYGYSIEPFNHYIVWPRFAATLLVGLILLEIYRDRRSQASLTVFYTAMGLLGAALIGLVVGDSIVDQSRTISTILIVLVSALIAQGYFHQISVIIQSGSTGAIAIKMSQFILLMDASTLLFAISMGLNSGWPLMLLAITSGVTKLIIMYLFRWARISPIAKQQRDRRSAIYQNKINHSPTKLNHSRRKSVTEQVVLSIMAA